MKTRFFFVATAIFCAIAIFSFNSCNKQSVATTPTNCDPSISFQNQVKPILESNCDLSGCHDGANLPTLATYTTCRDGASQIQNAISRSIMPPNKSLSAANKNIILCWISNGKLNN